MNILYISVLCGFTEPKSGGQNRIYNIAKQLLKNKNKVVILEPRIYFNKEDVKIAKIYLYDDLKILSREINLSKDFNMDFILTVRKIIKENNIEMIHFSHPSGVLAIKILTKLMGITIPIIYDSQNVESDFVSDVFKDSNKFSIIEKKIILIYVYLLERFTIKHIADHITAVSKDDKNRFISKYNVNNEKISLIPSGSNIRQLPSESEKYKIKKLFNINPSVITIVFHGCFSHLPNQKAFELIKNVIAPEFKDDDILFIVGGSGFPIYSKSNVKSIGFIENMNDFLKMSDIAIVPITQGGGTRIKILDYLGAGLPLVTTKKGVEGIEVKHCRDAIIVENVDTKFINSIRFLIDNEKNRMKIAENARNLSKKYYDWDIIGKKLMYMYKKFDSHDKFNPNE
jgi:glycosyltransferase involved in cell wall biosynthesis